MSRRSREERRLRALGRGVETVVSPPGSIDTAGSPRSASLTRASAGSYDSRAVVEDEGNEDRDDLSFGQLLRRERELRRITLREVHEATKINIRYLEALERNDFTYLPAGAFTRGFVRAYARYIGLDPSEMINAYLYELKRQEQEAERDPTRARPAIDDPVREAYGSEELEETARKRQRLRTVVIAAAVIVGLLLVVAATMFVIHQTRGLAGDRSIPRLEGSLS